MQIWLTGGSGCGKSTAAAVFQKNGYKIIDADRIARELTQKGGAAYDALIAAFPAAVCKETGEMDRKRLAAIVFRDENALEVLNSITHPYIIAEIKALQKGEKNVLMDVPLPNTFGVSCDKTLVITAPRNTRIQRIMARDALCESEAIARIDAQKSEAVYQKEADKVIVNIEENDFLVQIEILAKEWFTP